MTYVARLNGKTRGVRRYTLALLLSAPGILPALPVLTQVSDIRKLTAKEAQQGFPVRLRGVVTYFDTIGPDMFFQDATGGIWVNRLNTLPVARKGELIELEGVTVQTDFAPDIGKPHWRVVGNGAMPKPQHPSYERLASAAEDSNWVEVEATIRAVSADPNGGYLRMKLAVDGGRVLALLPPPVERVPTDLVEAHVLIHAVAATVFNRKNQILSPMLHVTSLSDIQILERTPGEPFQRP